MRGQRATEPRHTIAMVPDARDNDGVVHVWHADVSLFDARPDLRARALAALSTSDRDRYVRFRRAVDRDMFLLGRILARALVGRALRLDPYSWGWQDGERGRPEIAGWGGRASFNIAHSAGLVMCAAGAADRIGIDVEHAQRTPVDRDLMVRVCAPSELADLERRTPADRQARFLRYWTLKEAYLKARGLGISAPLAEACFALDGDRPDLTCGPALADAGERWAFHLGDLDGCLFAAAAPAAPGGRRIFRVEPVPADALA
jgi:4'-phosphopantetheinyl transferase